MGIGCPDSNCDSHAILTLTPSMLSGDHEIYDLDLILALSFKSCSWKFFVCVFKNSLSVENSNKKEIP